MNIVKGLSDMKDMLHAAPGLIESANEIAANAQANAAAHQQAAAAPVAAAQPGNLEPIATVDLELYARIAKGIAPYGYDQGKIVDVAASLGVTAQNWEAAQAGWAARIQMDPGVAAEFNRLYLAV